VCYLYLFLLIMSEYNIQILVYLTAGVMFSNIYTYVYHFIFISCEYLRYDDKLGFCLY
jgi:hypothetical protein